MNKPQRFVIKLSESQKYNEKFSKYIFELELPHKIDFDAGQYVSIKVNENGDRRSYSICSDPEIHHSFELLVDHSPNGIGTNFLRNLKFGEEVDTMGPLGKFVFDDNKDADELVFVATGCGITPLRSMIIDLLRNKKENRPITLYWGLRYVKDLFWEDEFQDLVDDYKNFKFHPVLSKAVEEWPLCRGRVTDCLSIHELPLKGNYYLCGNNKMIEDVSGLLQTKGVKKEDIYFEKFY